MLFDTLCSDSLCGHKGDSASTTPTTPNSTSPSSDRSLSITNDVQQITKNLNLIGNVRSEMNLHDESMVRAFEPNAFCIC